MRSSVYTDKALARNAGRFVWLSIDTENRRNDLFQQKFPLQDLPAMYIIDPADETLAGRWTGAKTVPELEKIFGEGERTVKAKARPIGIPKKK